MLLGHDYNSQAVFLSEHDLDRHGYMIGLPGTGKTTVLLAIAAGIISEKWGGMIVLDPHGDMSYDLLNLIPPSAADRVVLFDPVEQVERPFGLNLFDIPDPKRIDVSADWAVTALKKAIAADTTWPMTADRVARHLFFALAPQGGTLLEVTKFLSDRAYRTRFYKYMAEHQSTSFEYWHDIYDGWISARETGISREQQEEAGPILRRLDRYLADARLKNILGQPKVSLDIRDIMESGKVLIVRLPESELGSQAAGLLGSVILSHLFVATLGRSSQPREERKPFFVLIDEFRKICCARGSAPLLQRSPQVQPQDAGGAPASQPDRKSQDPGCRPERRVSHRLPGPGEGRQRAGPADRQQGRSQAADPQPISVLRQGERAGGASHGNCPRLRLWTEWSSRRDQREIGPAGHPTGGSGADYSGTQVQALHYP